MKPTYAHAVSNLPPNLTRRGVLLSAAAAFVAGCGAAAHKAAARATSSAVPSHPPVTPSTSPSPTPSLTPTGPASQVMHGPRTVNAVALTFHGAGDPALAQALLTEAESAGAKVTVFAVGTWLAQNPSMARRILDGGHALANHTYTHPDLTQLSAAGLSDEITRTRDLLTSLTGSTGTYFRPSQMDMATPAVLAAAGAAGYQTVVGYDVDPRDYQDPGATAIVERAMAAVAPGSVISLHLGHQGTVDAMPTLLADLKSRRLQAVTMEQLLA
jgi:peptidoglycan/xylan/chitin deacetylase (PgdA/CDA1 family)